MKKRIISAFVMCLICIPILLVGGIPFRILVGVLGIIAYKEFLNIKSGKKYPLLVEVLGLLILLLLVYSNRDESYGTIGLSYGYIAVSFLVMLLPSILYYKKEQYDTSDAFILTGFIIFLGIVLNLLSNILIYDRLYFYMIILVTILTDTFAYFTGMVIGKHKITKISPKKSLEGYIGGIVMGSVLTSIFYATFIGNEAMYKVVPVIVILSIVCELGDLFYSLIKREKDIKDFSNLIPGHGGILDRIDSLTFVALAFILLRGFI